MTDISEAIQLTRRGFHIFPLRPGSKLPAIEAFPTRATREPEKIERWAKKYPDCNWGISTSKFGDDEALVVVDVDGAGHGKDGPSELVRLELDGKEFPLTCEHATPSGGRHIIYRVPAAVRQGTDVLARGLDVRSRGGYIVAPGSRVPLGEYFTDRPDRPAAAPQWLIDACGAAPERTPGRKALDGINADRARQRALAYLQHEAPEAIEGAGGDFTTYKVAARLKDLGVTAEVALDLMMTEWHEGCGWTNDELATKVRNAYKYGENPQGADAPEAQFQPVEDEAPGEPKKLSPLAELNKQYALVHHKGDVTIYREEIRASGQREYHPMKASSFDLALQTRKLDGKPLAKVWREWTGRREYCGGVDFLPEGQVRDGVLNLWGGFAVKEQEGDWSLFRGHIRDVICNGDAAVDDYVMNWLAHMVQRPQRPPGVAIVLRGGEGVGKGAFAKLLGEMFGEAHYVPLGKSDQLTGKFNSHLARKVLAFADESYACDHRAASALKNMLTEDTFLMEAKGFDAVQVRNCVHVIMASNDHHVVQASRDQRRFCVVDVSSQHKCDKSYFDPIFDQMRQAGGTAAMLYDLRRRDISCFDVGKFPQTEAMADQKLASLRGPEAWLHACLWNAVIGYEEWTDEAVRVRKSDAYEAYKIHARDKREDAPVGESQFWQTLIKILKTQLKEVRLAEAGRPRVRIFPALSDGRKAFDEFLGYPLPWEELD
ncbi:bifunctional DNA primase/polymerase [Luteibacter sp.]|uniref:bifunctional DNA primase/polymerase n=1 Tax=Luteibacter sp. TaxID=1886636 RepID=UPI003F7FF66B